MLGPHSRAASAVRSSTLRSVLSQLELCTSPATRHIRTYGDLPVSESRKPNRFVDVRIFDYDVQNRTTRGVLKAHGNGTCSRACHCAMAVGASECGLLTGTLLLAPSECSRTAPHKELAN